MIYTVSSDDEDIEEVMKVAEVINKMDQAEEKVDVNEPVIHEI